MHSRKYRCSESNKRLTGQEEIKTQGNWRDKKFNLRHKNFDFVKSANSSFIRRELNIGGNSREGFFPLAVRYKIDNNWKKLE